MLQERVHAFFIDHRLVEPGDTLLLAVSGGPDSSALLYLLLALRDSLGVNLEVAHLDHGHRGNDSRADARFVAEIAAEEGLTLHHRAVDIAEARADTGGSLEAVARRIRYAFLEEAARKAGARWVLTGHCADDQVETLLLNFCRGAGTRGLGGMLPVGPGRLCRPLLGIWKRDLVSFLEENDLPYRLDATNTDLSLTRNWVRNRLIPDLKDHVSPGVAPVLARSARLFSELDDFLAEEADAFLDAFSEEDGDDAVRIDLPALIARHAALRRVVLRSAIEDMAGGLRDFGMSHVDAILELATGDSGSGEAHLPRGLVARREYDHLILSRDPVGDVPVPAGAPELDLDRMGRLRWGNLSLSWTVRPPREVLGMTPEEDGDRERSTAWFDLASLALPVRLRGIRPGDRLEPTGMTGSQKVSDLLINRKVPRHRRPRIGVLCDNGGPGGSERVLWVVGHRLGRHAPVGPDSSQVVVLQAETN